MFIEMEEYRDDKNWAYFYKIKGFTIDSYQIMYTRSCSSNSIFLRENDFKFFFKIKSIFGRYIKMFWKICPLSNPPCPNKISRIPLNLITFRQKPSKFCYPTTELMPLNIFMAIWINFKIILHNTPFSIFRLLVWPNQVEFKSPLPKTLGLWEQQ